MRDAIKIVHGAVERIDHPLMGAGLVAHDTFLAVESVLGKLVEQQSSDEILRLHVDGQFDIMRFRAVDAKGSVKVGAEQLAGSTRGLLGCFPIMRHENESKGAGEACQMVLAAPKRKAGAPMRG